MRARGVNWSDRTRRRFLGPGLSPARHQRPRGALKRRQPRGNHTLARPFAACTLSHACIGNRSTALDMISTPEGARGAVGDGGIRGRPANGRTALQWGHGVSDGTADPPVVSNDGRNGGASGSMCGPGGRSGLGVARAPEGSANRGRSARSPPAAWTTPGSRRGRRSPFGRVRRASALRRSTPSRASRPPRRPSAPPGRAATRPPRRARRWLLPSAAASRTDVRMPLWAPGLLRVCNATDQADLVQRRLPRPRWATVHAVTWQDRFCKSCACTGKPARPCRQAWTPLRCDPTKRVSPRGASYPATMAAASSNRAVAASTVSYRATFTISTR